MAGLEGDKMRYEVPVDINVGTLATMTAEQFVALRDNILAEGHWENQIDIRVRGAGDYVGVYVGGMFIGIEKDGYTHS
jgi:hypothetical protein